REGMRLVAPLAGAGIFALAGGAAVALVDAATFVISAGTLFALRFEEPVPAPREHHFLREMSAGLVHIARTPVLRQLTIGIGAVLLVAGFGETLVFAITGGLHHKPTFVGVIDSFQGVGAIAGGVSAPWMLRRIGDLRLAGVGVALFGAGIALWLISDAAVVLAGTAVAGAGIVWAVVSLSTAYQRRSPADVQGRVAAAANMLFSVPQTISIAAGAALIALIDWRIEIVAVCCVFALASAYMLTRPNEAAKVEPALA
ncbi:MAG TPA: MFS transporter, partial [Gaiellaceae bacterium]|nr:MFS transporter [Gaiellaceae bacterium]